MENKSMRDIELRNDTRQITIELREPNKTSWERIAVQLWVYLLGATLAMAIIGLVSMSYSLKENTKALQSIEKTLRVNKCLVEKPIEAKGKP